MIRSCFVLSLYRYGYKEPRKVAPRDQLQLVSMGQLEQYTPFTQNVPPHFVPTPPLVNLASQHCFSFSVAKLYICPIYTILSNLYKFCPIYTAIFKKS